MNSTFSKEGCDGRLSVKTVCGICNGSGRIKLGFLPIMKKCSRCNGCGKLKRPISF